MSLRNPREGFERFQQKRKLNDTTIMIDASDLNSLLQAAYELKKLRLTHPGIQSEEESIVARIHSGECLSEQHLQGLKEAKSTIAKFGITKGDMSETIEHDPTKGKTFSSSAFAK